MGDISNLLNEIKEELKGFNLVGENTDKSETDATIRCYENPLNPELLLYCFRNIKQYKIPTRIGEKANYIIELDYKGTYVRAEHMKMSYSLKVRESYKEEIIDLFANIKSLLEELFSSMGEQALCDNRFHMKNEAIEYFNKLAFFQERIEKLNKDRDTISKCLAGQWDEVKVGPFTSWRPKGQVFMNRMHDELVYDIETYIATFFSALEHVLTLLFPFSNNFSMSESYFKKYIQNPRWHWDKKIEDVCDKTIPEALFSELRRIKEVYRNHNAHGAFSREMMAFIHIDDFGNYPMYIGKNYLKGFLDNEDDSITYELYENVRDNFNEFWAILDKEYEIPMRIIKSGLPIPVDTSLYMNEIGNKEDAESFIDRLWFEIDNQVNMDW